MSEILNGVWMEQVADRLDALEEKVKPYYYFVDANTLKQGVDKRSGKDRRYGKYMGRRNYDTNLAECGQDGDIDSGYGRRMGERRKG
jgi:hypothetical protein